MKYSGLTVGEMNLLLVLFLLLFLASCSEQDNVSSMNGGKKSGTLELNVRVSNFSENTGGGHTEQEAAIKNLSLFLFYPDGRELVQADRRQTLVDGKISVAIPAEAVGQELSAYLVANEDIDLNAIFTESSLLQLKTVRPVGDFISSGFPMSTGRIAVLLDAGKVIAVDAELKRVPSAIYVQVESPSGMGIRNNSYKIEIEGLQTAEGAMFQNIASATSSGKVDYSDKLSAVNTPEHIAYFYQSERITIHIIPRDANLGEEKVFQIGNTTERNKRFLLRIIPVQSAATTRIADYSIQVSERDVQVIVD